MNKHVLHTICHMFSIDIKTIVFPDSYLSDKDMILKQDDKSLTISAESCQRLDEYANELRLLLPGDISILVCTYLCPFPSAVNNKLSITVNGDMKNVIDKYHQWTRPEAEDYSVSEMVDGNVVTFNHTMNIKVDDNRTERRMLALWNETPQEMYSEFVDWFQCAQLFD